MPNWEFEPTPGPLPYLGAGVMLAIGGTALMWAQTPLIGIVVLAAGLLTSALSTRQFLRDRDADRHEP